MARPRTYDDETRRALVEATAEILATQGPRHVSVRAVAERVGATTSAIYALFGSKAELVRATFVTGFQGLAEAFEAVPEHEDPWEEIGRLGLAYRASAIARPHLYEVMFGRPIEVFEPNEADAALASSTLDRLRRAVRRVATSGGGLPDGLDIEAATLALWARVHGLASLELAGALGDQGESLWRATIAADRVGWRKGPAAVSAPG